MLSPHHWAARGFSNGSINKAFTSTFLGKDGSPVGARFSCCKTRKTGLTVGCSSFCRHVLGRYCELSPAQGVTNRAVNETDLV